MSYTASSLLISPAVGTPQQWADALRPHNAWDADVLANTYFKYGPIYDINVDLLLAQMCHETGWATSKRYTDEHNMAGLGIVADNTPPNPFRSLGEGVRAHYEHACCYAYSRSTCPVDHAHTADRRHLFHKNSPLLSGLEDVPPKWAVPGTGYVESIVGIANSVIGGSEPVAYPSQEDIGVPVRIEPTSFQGGARTMGDIDYYVIHDTEGHYEGDIGVLTHGSQSGSVHFIIGREVGQFCASVPIGNTAWTAGNDTLGARAIQFELSKATDEHGYTDWQYDALCKAIRWCQKQGVTVPLVYLGLHPKDDDNGPLPDERGIIGHAGVPDGAGGWGGFAHHTDPGPDFDWLRLIGLTGIAPGPASPWPVVDGQSLGPGFFQLYNATSPDTAARLRTFGKLLRGDHNAILVQADGHQIPVVAAVWERTTLIWDKGATAAPFDVRAPLQTERVAEKG